MVVREIPVALETIDIPPQPRLDASVAAHILRLFSFKQKLILLYFSLTISIEFFDISICCTSL